MKTQNFKENPFKVFTPENMPASDVNDLFVDPFTDFNKIRDSGHTMVNGPRGCGKSMIFRFLLPDCQSLALNQSINELPFLAFLVSIKNTVPNLTELRRLQDYHADIILNEHFLVSFVSSKIFESISRLDLSFDEHALDAAKQFLNDVLNNRLKSCGAEISAPKQNFTKATDVFAHIASIFDDLYGEVIQYVRRLTFMSDGDLRYDSALCGYMDFLFPILSDLRNLPFFSSAPIYLLVDDADHLNTSQTMVLNSWVSTRTQADVSIKISTQLRYKTFSTPSGLPIQSPHDFQSINIADIYTSRHSRYLNRIEEITKRRLTKARIVVTPRVFFPHNEEQERKVSEIAEQLRAKWEKEGRGHRPGDDALRYARPNYIRSLGGPSKSRPTYSYSGFEHLVHISSGLVRYFLEAAAVMFDEQQSQHPDQSVTHIKPAIQNSVLRTDADSMMLGEFDNILRSQGSEPMQITKLRNLVSALGGTFFLKLVSEDSERRVFSVALSGRPDNEVAEVFELGVRYGYFHRSSIGNKDGTGRARLYVLTRRLAPYFILDPTSFAGYLWITNDLLQEAMARPESLLRRIKERGVNNILETRQLTLFD